jgi:hypothetical protein
MFAADVPNGKFARGRPLLLCYPIARNCAARERSEMHREWLAGALLVWLVVAAHSVAWSQQRSLGPNQPSIMSEEDGASPPPGAGQPTKGFRAAGHSGAPALDPDLDAADQLAPSQIRQPMPAAVAEPTGTGHGTRGAALEPGAEARPSASARSDNVVCNGVFARDSSHAKLAMAFQSRNVAFTQVDGPSGAKIMATVLFAKDPKRRLEVWWTNPASRSDTHLIVINGTSNWSAAGQLHLGLTLPQLEQINGKPIKLSGFDKNNVATLTDWNGGNLSVVAGGCKVGVSLRSRTASASTLGALPASREFTSSDAAMRTVNPEVSEILIAY